MDTRVNRLSFQIGLGILTAFLWPSLNSSAHPAISPGKDHPHTDLSILWEDDGIKDGTSGHNHLQARGHGSAVMNEVPTDASHCWDDKISRYVDSGTLGNETGHCYISGTNGTQNRAPTYSFDGPESDWTPVGRKNITRIVKQPIDRHDAVRRGLARR